ncbi:MAG: F0F1 ATP synthase subunit gamma [Candidatus Daviesbacteria bacterium]|nr:F0F1 ATP synthase subunit gamma [Candidatus Daviesbacteria bacterium]
MAIKQIDESIEEGESLKAIAQAYSEISNLKIKRIRTQVERNRVFFDEILQVYAIVRAFALYKKVSVVKPKKRLCILLTSNYRFYGAINSSLTNYFTGSTRELQDVDKLIIGKGGINYFRSSKLLPSYQEMLLKDDMPTGEELTSLANLSANYNQVLVFHAKMKSLLIQVATFTDVTATSLYTREFYIKAFDTRKKENMMRFIFEPELPKILNFFETQIITLLLEQTFLESELSRTASRFIAMDSAETEANKFIKEYQKMKALAKRNLDNNAILENFAAMTAIRKEKSDNI